MLRLSPVDRAYARFRQAGDPHALARVFDATANELLGIAAYLVGDRERARDIVQSTFLLAIEKRDEFVPGRRVMPWLCGVVANLARSENRRLHRLAPADATEATAENTAEDTLQTVEAREFRRVLDAIRANLSPTYRPVLDLHLLQGLNAEEIARALDRPAGTVRTQIIRGMKILRRRIPRGFAIGVAAAVTLPGTVSAMRQVVLAAASLAVPAGVTGGTATAILVGGGTLKKNLLIGSVLALSALGAWLTWTIWPSDPGGVDPTATRLDEIGARESTTAALHIGPDAPGARTPVDPDPAPAVETATVGAVVITVRWHDDRSPARNQEVQVVYWNESHGRLHPHRSLTDAAGRVRLEQLPAGPATVQIATGTKQDIEVLADQVVEVALTARALVTVAGRVIDSRGQPVADARIWLSSEFAYRRHPGLRLEHRTGHGQYGTFVTRSDAGGKFEFRADTSQCVAAFKDGYGPSESFYVRRPSGTTKDPRDAITLALTQDGSSLEVVVRDKSGQPVRDAHVVAGTESPHMTGTSDAAATTPALRASTDAGGRCAFSGLPAGTIRLQARAPGFAPWSARPTLVRGNLNEVWMELTPGAVVTGRITDEQGKSVGDAVVTFGRASQLAGTDATSDGEGRFRLADLPAGIVELTAWRRGGGEAVHNLELRAGESQTWDPVLSKRPAITGVVHDSSGRPVKQASLVTFGSSGGAAVARASTDGRGRFALGPLKQGDLYHVRASIRYPGGGRIRIDRFEVKPETEIELRAETGMEPTTGIRGRLIRRDGSPYVPANICIQALDGPAGAISKVDADGRFASEKRPAGRIHLAVSAGMRTIADLGQHELKSHEVLDLGDLVVPEAGAVRFAIRDRDALAGGVANFYLNSRVFDSLRITTDNLKEQKLPPGQYLLCVRRGGEHPLAGAISFVVRSGETTDVEFTPTRAHRTKLRLGAGASGWYQLRLRDSRDSPPMRYSTGKVIAGSVETFLFPEGHWQLEVWRKQTRLATLAVTVPAAAEVRLPRLAK